MLLVHKLCCITDESAAAGESGYQSLQAYLSLDQVCRHVSFPAVLCKLACAKMSVKIVVLANLLSNNTSLNMNVLCVCSCVFGSQTQGAMMRA